MKKYLLLILPIFFILSGHASAACGNGFSFCRTVTLVAAKIPANQSNFTALVCANQTLGNGNACATVTGLNQTGGGANVQNSNGYDITYWTNADCTGAMNWETEKYVASTGEIDSWVLIPSLSTSGNTFYMCYGKASISTFQGGSVGSEYDGSTMAVYRLPDGTTVSGSDSSANGYNLTNHFITATAGQMDGGIAGGSGAYLSSPTIPTASSYTIETWFKTSQTTGHITTFSATNANFYELYINNGTIEMLWGWGGGSGTTIIDCGTAVANGAWHQMWGVYPSGGSAQVYLDGSLCATGASPTNIPSPFTSFDYGHRQTIGGVEWVGSLDNLVLASTNRSGNWIATEYNNQSSPSTFETFGAEGTSSVFIPRLLILLVRMFIRPGVFNFIN